MGLFSFGKKRKEEVNVAAIPPPPGLPIDQILTMKGQGYADSQIIENLQSQGYNSSQINDSLNQANMSQQYPPQQPIPEQPYPPDYQGGYGEMHQPTQQPEAATASERIEELAEAIIDEKWDELVKDINKIAEWKEKTESRLNRIEQSLEDMKLGMESLHKSLVAKLSDYDKNLGNVGVEIKAMEKVFQKILPSLTDSVSRLEGLGKKASKK